jgi:hypothetical protein
VREWKDESENEDWLREEVLKVLVRDWSQGESCRWRRLQVGGIDRGKLD